jgi:hypothetical protein
LAWFQPLTTPPQQRKPGIAAATGSSGIVKPILPPSERQDQAKFSGGIADGALSESGQLPSLPPVAITPTVYPADWSGSVIVQSQITINIQSDEYRKFNNLIGQLLEEMRRSNAIAGEARDQLITEITAGTTLITAPKADRNWIDLLLVRPLRYIAEKAGGAVIGKLAGDALEWLLKMLG